MWIHHEPLSIQSLQSLSVQEFQKACKNHRLREKVELLHFLYVSR